MNTELSIQHKKLELIQWFLTVEDSAINENIVKKNYRKNIRNFVTKFC